MSRIEAGTGDPGTVWTQAASAAKYVLYGGGRLVCPICSRRSRRFAAFGDPRRPSARCGWCSSLERHRLVWLYFERRTNLFDGQRRRVLHVAPERCLERRLRLRIGSGYLTADFNDARADVRMDIMNIEYPDGTFDFIYCSHVLEHVADDRRAMREFRRVLNPEGTAVLLVPITSARTIEDPTITDPAERRRLFGQHDHVRRYGADYVNRLTDAGFAVEVHDVRDLATDEEVARMNLTAAAGQIHVCRHSNA
jgi:predicted SAM-dependent methyltransferase